MGHTVDSFRPRGTSTGTIEHDSYTTRRCTIMRTFVPINEGLHYELICSLRLMMFRHKPRNTEMVTERLMNPSRPSLYTDRS